MNAKFFTVLLLGMVFEISTAPLVQAMPEEKLGTHANGAITKAILASHGDISLIRSQLSTTGIPELDALWTSAQTVPADACGIVKRPNCRVLSVFHGRVSDRPIVLLPGFTGYRKMYIEQVYDLLEGGYGPVYVSDFIGTGDSYIPELGAAQKKITIQNILFGNGPLDLKSPKVATLFSNQVSKIVGSRNLPEFLKVLYQEPIGRGYIDDFNEYEKDIDFAMKTAIAENPQQKIIMTSLSASGLSVMLALAHQDQKPTWITHLDRIILESPMIRVRGTDNLLGFPVFGFVTEILAAIAQGFPGKVKLAAPEKSLPEFVNKALGNWDPTNVITHSKNRVTLTDSMRVWNGHETAGVTYAWGFQELKHQYSKGPLDNWAFVADPLNYKSRAIADALKRNHVTLITVSSDTDGLVDPEATRGMMSLISSFGAKNAYLCRYKTAHHVIDQESDKYREPYLALLFDMKERRNQTNQAPHPTYGVAPRNELLRCYIPPEANEWDLYHVNSVLDGSGLLVD
jgi:alpha-beta hydrolase superfamily lysophospholipase